jgi:hypothetical protein
MFHLWSDTVDSNFLHGPIEFAITRVNCISHDVWYTFCDKVEFLWTSKNDCMKKYSTKCYCFLVHLDQWPIAITWHPSSVVCKLFTFQASSPKPLGQLEPNLAGMFLGWSSRKLLFFIPVVYSTWVPGPIICSDWLKFQRSSSLKLMNCVHDWVLLFDSIFYI